MPEEAAAAVEVTVENGPPEDYAEYVAWVDKGGSSPTEDSETPAAGDPTTPSSEPADASEEAEAGQTAEASEAADTSTEQVTAEEDDQIADQDKDTRLARRMRKLTGTIAELQSRLDALGEGEADDEIPGEVASPPEAVAPKAAETLKRPRLSDFEDTDTRTQFEQYEDAKDAYQDAKTAAQLNAAIEGHKAELARERQEADFRVSKAAHDADWKKAAERFPDYNEVVAKPEVQVSGAMEAVMRMDPVAGTEMAYYLGQHPEESKIIANETVIFIDPRFKEGTAAYQAEGQRLWNMAMARAALKLGAIHAKAQAAPKPGQAKTEPAPKPAAVAPKSPAIPATPPPPKKTSSAHPPPTTLRPSGTPPKFDLMNPKDAEDVGRWLKERNAQADKDGRR